MTDLAIALGVLLAGTTYANYKLLDQEFAEKLDEALDMEGMTEKKKRVVRAVASVPFGTIVLLKKVGHAYASDDLRV